MNSFRNTFEVQDIYHTPAILVDILRPYLERNLPQDKIILCPFDTERSEYVRRLEEWGYTVKHGSLETGQDFFDYDYGYFDIVISNPPFSRKKEIYQKLFSENKPFMLLGNLMQVNYQEIGNLFFNQHPPVQFIIPDKKVSFDGGTSSFCSGYICWKAIPHTSYIHVEHNNSGKNPGKTNSYTLGWGI